MSSKIYTVNLMTLEPTNEKISEILKEFQGDESVQIIISKKESELARNLLSNEAAVLLLFCSNNGDVKKIAKFLNFCKKALKKRQTKIIIVSKLNNSLLADMFQKLGCNDYISNTIATNTLKFKIKVQMKAISALLKAIDLEKKNQEHIIQKSSSSENTNNSNVMHFANGNSSKLILLKEDLWLFKGSEPKKIEILLVVDCEGPDPKSGQWYALGKDPSTHQERWRWIPHNQVTDNTKPEQEDGWEFQGECPKFNDKTQQWSLASEKPDLSYIKNGEKVASKLSLDNDGNPVIAPDSPQVKKNILKTKNQSDKTGHVDYNENEEGTNHSNYLKKEGDDLDSKNSSLSNFNSPKGDTYGRGSINDLPDANQNDTGSSKKSHQKDSQFQQENNPPDTENSASYSQQNKSMDLASIDRDLENLKNTTNKHSQDNNVTDHKAYGSLEQKNDLKKESALTSPSQGEEKNSDSQDLTDNHSHREDDTSPSKSSAHVRYSAIELAFNQAKQAELNKSNFKSPTQLRKVELVKNNITRTYIECTPDLFGDRQGTWVLNVEKHAVLITPEMRQKSQNEIKLLKKYYHLIVQTGEDLLFNNQNGYWLLGENVVIEEVSTFHDLDLGCKNFLLTKVAIQEDKIKSKKKCAEFTHFHAKRSRELIKKIHPLTSDTKSTNKQTVLNKDEVSKIIENHKNQPKRKPNPMQKKNKTHSQIMKLLIEVTDKLSKNASSSEVTNLILHEVRRYLKADSVDLVDSDKKILLSSTNPDSIEQSAYTLPHIDLNQDKPFLHNSVVYCSLYQSPYLICINEVNELTEDTKLFLSSIRIELSRFFESQVKAA